VAVGAAAAEPCTHDTLAAVAGVAGDVLARESLPTVAKSTVEAEVEHIEVRCQDEETDADCLARVQVEKANRPRQGQSIRVRIESDGKRILALLVEDGVDESLYFPTYEAVAIHMEQKMEEGRIVALLLAEQQADLETRRAVVTVLEQRPEIRTLGPGLRVRVQPSMSHAKAFSAMGAAADPHGVEVVTWTVDDSGVIVLEMRCPGPTD
jgi:hypothetical protein